MTNYDLRITNEKLLKNQHTLSFPSTPGGGYPPGHPINNTLIFIKILVTGSPIKSSGKTERVFQMSLMTKCKLKTASNESFQYSQLTFIICHM